jgi:hypothetical protein
LAHEFYGLFIKRTFRSNPSALLIHVERVPVDYAFFCGLFCPLILTDIFANLAEKFRPSTLQSSAFEGDSSRKTSSCTSEYYFKDLRGTQTKSIDFVGTKSETISD